MVYNRVMPKYCRYIFKILLVCFALKVLMPLLSILIFAQHPLDALFGHRATEISVEGNYICHMGIEWKAGSSIFLNFMGNNHNAHQDHSNHQQEMSMSQEMMDHSHHQMNHGDHHNMSHQEKQNETHHDNKGTSPDSEPECLLDMTMNGISTLKNLLAAASFAVFVYFLIYILFIYIKNGYFRPSFLLKLLKFKTAPPVFG